MESREVSPGVVLNFDGTGQLVGIDIDHASKNVEMGNLRLLGVPADLLRREAS